MYPKETIRGAHLAIANHAELKPGPRNKTEAVLCASTEAYSRTVRSFDIEGELPWGAVNSMITELVRRVEESVKFLPTDLPGAVNLRERVFNLEKAVEYQERVYPDMFGPAYAADAIREASYKIMKELVKSDQS